MIPLAQLLELILQLLCRSLRDYAPRFHSSCDPPDDAFVILALFEPHFAPECPLPRARLDHSQRGPDTRPCERPLHTDPQSRSRTMFLLNAMCFAMFHDATWGTRQRRRQGSCPYLAARIGASPPSNFHRV